MTISGVRRITGRILWKPSRSVGSIARISRSSSSSWPTRPEFRTRIWRSPSARSGAPASSMRSCSAPTGIRPVRARQPIQLHAGYDDLQRLHDHVFRRLQRRLALPARLQEQLTAPGNTDPGGVSSLRTGARPAPLELGGRRCGAPGVSWPVEKKLTTSSRLVDLLIDRIERGGRIPRPARHSSG